MMELEVTARHIITDVTADPARDEPASWLVEAIGAYGEIYWALFGGPGPERRALEFARLKFDFNPPTKPRHRLP